MNEFSVWGSVPTEGGSQMSKALTAAMAIANSHIAELRLKIEQLEQEVARLKEELRVEEEKKRTTEAMAELQDEKMKMVQENAHLGTQRAIDALRQPDASLAQVPNTIRQSLAEVIENVEAENEELKAEIDRLQTALKCISRSHLPPQRGEK